MRTRSLLLSLVVVCGLCVLLGSLGSGSVWAETISDNFDSGLSPVLWSRYVQPGTYDPWTIAAPDSSGRLEISKPADSGALNETIHGGVRSNFKLEGDFTIDVDFDLVSYPHPGGGYNEVLLRVKPANEAHEFAVLKFSIRSSSTSYGEYFEGWSVPPVTTLGGTEDYSRSGTFELQRVGQTMSALVDRGSGMELLGSITDPAFAGPMSVYLFGAQVVRSATGERPFSDLDIRFDNFSVTADTIVPEPGTLLLLTSGLVGLVGKLRRRR